MAKDDISFSKNEKEFKFGSKCIGISSNKVEFVFLFDILDVYAKAVESFMDEHAQSR